MFTALNPYLLYIKIAAVVVVAGIIGGLYWYGKHESALVDTANQRIGQANQVIADAQANITALKAGNDAWVKAFATYQTTLANQRAATIHALALKEKINAQLANLEARLRSDPAGSAVRLNALDDELVCLLDRASGDGNIDGCTDAPAAAPAAPPAAPAHP